MLHGIFEHLPVEDIHVDMVRLLDEVSVKDCHKVFNALVFCRAERLWYDRECVADTVHSIVVIQFCDRAQ